jgi:hypothetical protein
VLTIALAAFLLAALVLVVAGADLGSWAVARVGAGDTLARVWSMAQWCAPIALVVFAVDLVYPNGAQLAESQAPALQWWLDAEGEHAVAHDPVDAQPRPCVAAINGSARRPGRRAGSQTRR